MLKRNANGKSGFTRFISQMMAVLLVIATVLTVSPGVTKAADPVDVPAVTDAVYVVSTKVSNNAYNIEITFNAPVIRVEGADIWDNVLIKRSGFSVFTTANNEYVDDLDFDYNKLTIYMDQPLIGSTNEIKILAGTLKNSADITNASNNKEIIIKLDTTGPQFVSQVLSTDNKTVTLTFDENILEGSFETFTISNVANLKQYVYLSRNGNYGFEGSLDYEAGTNTVGIDPNDTKKLVITFERALNRVNNVIRLASGAITDASGNQNNEILTPSIVSTIAYDELPYYLNVYYINNNNHDIVLEFSENVVNHTAGELKDVTSVVYYSEDVEEYIPVPMFTDPSTTVTTNKNTLVIHFAAPLADYEYRVKINASALADTEGNVIADSIEECLGINSDVTPPVLDSAYIYNSHKYLDVYFNESIFDNTILNDKSSLKSKIQISRSGGAYVPLEELDNVVIQYGRLVILFSQPQHINFTIKLAGSALKDFYGNVQKNEIITKSIVVENSAIYNDNITGDFYTNVSSELLFEDNATWRSRISSVILRENSNFDMFFTRTLTADEYKISAGKIVINAGVFKLNSGGTYINIYAEGYDSTEIYRTPLVSTDSYYMTAPVLTIANGITASVKIAKNQADYPNTSVIFQLMKGATPVSIVSLNAPLSNGTYIANFNVSNPNLTDYTVQAFLVDKYSNDPTTLGVNLAKIVTQAELDLIDYEKESD